MCEREGRAVAAFFHAFPLPSLRCHHSSWASYLSPHSSKTSLLTRAAPSTPRVLRCPAETRSASISPSGTRGCDEAELGVRLSSSHIQRLRQRAGVRWIAPSSKNAIPVLMHLEKCPGRGGPAAARESKPREPKPGWRSPSCAAAPSWGSASGEAVGDQSKEEAEEKGKRHPSALPTRYESRCSSCSTGRKNTEPSSHRRAQPCPALPPALPADAQRILAAGAGTGTKSLGWFKLSQHLAKRIQPKGISEASSLSWQTVVPIFFLSRQFRRGTKLSKTT